MAEQVEEPAEEGAGSVRLARSTWRRGQIIASATRLMEEHGFHGMSMQALATDAGISVGLIYQYVPRKDDVLLLVIVDILDAYKSELPPAIAAHDDPCEQLAAGFTAYCKVIDGRRSATALAYRETATLGKDGRDRLKALELETTRLLAEVVERGVEAEIFVDCDADLVAYDIAMLAHTWALKHWYLRERMTLDRYVEVQLAFLLRGLLRPRRRASYRRFLEVGA